MSIVPDNDRSVQHAVALRDEGCERAAAKHRDDIAECQRRFVEHLLAVGPGTIDDADDPTAHGQKFAEKRGNWRGTVVRELVELGIIEATGERRRSRRPSRHATENREWRIADIARAMSWVVAHTPTT